MNQQFEAVKARNTKLEKNMKEMLEDVEAMSSDLRHERDVANKLRKEISELEKEVKILDQVGLEEGIEIVDSNLVDRIHKIRGEIQRLIEARKNAEKSKQDLKNMENEYDINATELWEQKDKAEKLQVENTKLDSDRQHFEQNAEKLKGELEKLKEKNEKLEAQCTKMEKDRQELEQNLKEISKKVESQTAEIENLQKENEILKKVDQAPQEVVELRQQLAETVKDNEDKISNINNSVLRDKRLLLNQTEVFANDLSSLKAALRNAREEFKALRDVQDRYDEYYQVSERTKQEYQLLHQQLRENIAQLQNRTSKLDVLISLMRERKDEVGTAAEPTLSALLNELILLASEDEQESYKSDNSRSSRRSIQVGHLSEFLKNERNSKRFSVEELNYSFSDDTASESSFTSESDSNSTPRRVKTKPRTLARGSRDNILVRRSPNAPNIEPK
jgi:chromosome segregation ATPase